MAGMRIASTDGAGWTVETVELTLTRRRTTRRSRVGPVPLGDGAQLRVTRNGHLIGYCFSPDDLPALGVDMTRMAVVARWLTVCAVAGLGNLGRLAIGGDFLYRMGVSQLTTALVSAILSRRISPSGGFPVSSAGTP